MKKDMKVIPALFPMPVILISTYNEDGSVDVMNAAWGCAFDYSQLYLNIDPGHKTFKNIERTKAFSVSLADADHIKEADFVGMVSANTVKDKFLRSGLHASKAEKVNAPILDDFSIVMECEAVEINKDRGIIGEIKRLAVEEKYLDANGKVDVEKLNIIAYDPFNHGYYVINKKVGQAFSDGRKLK